MRARVSILGVRGSSLSDSSPTMPPPNESNEAINAIVRSICCSARLYCRSYPKPRIRFGKKLQIVMGSGTAAARSAAKTAIGGRPTAGARVSRLQALSRSRRLRLSGALRSVLSRTSPLRKFYAQGCASGLGCASPAALFVRQLVAGGQRRRRVDRDAILDGIN